MSLPKGAIKPESQFDIMKTPFLLFQERRYNYTDAGQMALGNLLTLDQVSQVFFGEENIKRVQRLIKLRVWKETKGKFKIEEDQDVDDLIIAMRGPYLDYGTNELIDIDRQVNDLNNIVLDTIVPGIITNIKQYYGYLRDINTPLTPMQRPENVSQAGRKTLPSLAKLNENIYS